ncbi:FAD-dependent monooxygenase [Streptomyces sp. NBC_01465]|uniref:FAD-dependent monooxygenase n=1 Tax=Streptomyces sp. NBC_01465 TaxID=2903878 RepID=UPI002E37F7CD|nr:FAD-dependent monooxygenase [Streptomyces sp. NBC_01465]
MLDVLIVGAGPVGLTAGCILAQQGHAVRVVRKHPPFTGHSRASVIWPRALEIMESIGVTESLRAMGSHVTRIGYYSSGTSIGRFELDRLDDTAFRFALGVSQHETEAVLEAALRAAGGTVDDAELLALEQDEGHVTARLRRDGADATVSARFLIGADGANSTVRALLGIATHDVGPRVSFRIADAVVDQLPEDEASYCWTPAGGMAIGPHDRGAFRLAHRIAPDDVHDTSVESFQRLLDERGPGGRAPVVRELISTADFQARFAIAERFRVGRCYLAGDSAHVMAPAGGQGMNSGMLDAAALSWRMLEALRNGAADSALAEYDAERQVVIRKIMATAVEHARDGGLRSDEDIAVRDQRYRAMWQNAAQHKDRVARLSQLTVDPARAAGASIPS